MSRYRLIFFAALVSIFLLSDCAASRVNHVAPSLPRLISASQYHTLVQKDETHFLILATTHKAAQYIADIELRCDKKTCAMMTVGTLLEVVVPVTE